MNGNASWLKINSTENLSNSLKNLRKKNESNNKIPVDFLSEVVEFTSAE